MQRFSFTVVVLLLALGSHGQQKRPAWAWTVEERIALRTDAAAARARVRSNLGAVANAATSEAVAERRPIVDQFDGKHHPELFLPSQVFEKLLTFAFASDARMAQAIRQDLMRDVISHGLPSDFWLRLEGIAAAPVSDYRAVVDLLRSPSMSTKRGRTEQELALKNQDLCRDTAAALATARAEFGRERLDQFLYDAIAVNMFSVSDKLPDADILRWRERGCR